MTEKHTLIFVYNANSGAFNAIFGAVHKVVSPNTYKRNLCKITYRVSIVKKEWKQYLQKLDIPVLFLHKDEFKKKYDYKNPKFPAIFVNHDNKIKQIISASEINNCSSVRDLIELVTDKTSSIH